MLPSFRNPVLVLACLGAACGADVGVGQPPAGDEVAYRVLVRSFLDSDGDGVGDLAGLTSQLDLLNDGEPSGGDDLGVDVVVVMPLGPSLDALGYHSLDHRAISERLGTEADFRRLAEAVDARGMRLVVELPLVEVSVAHPRFQEAITDVESDAGAWFRWRDSDPGWTEPWEGMKNPTWHPSPRGFYYAAFGRELPQLRVESPAVRSDLLDTIRWWRERGADGVRITSASFAVPEAGADQWNSEATVRFWAELAGEVRAEAPELTVWLDLNGPSGAGERYLAASTNLHVSAPGFGEALTRTLRMGSGTPFRVDAEARAGRGYLFGLDGPARRRAAEDFHAMPVSLRHAWVLQLTQPGVVELFYGQPTAIRHNDALSDVNRVPPLAWTNEPPTYGFTTGSRSWQAFGPESERRNVTTARRDPESSWALARELMALRRAHPALDGGTFVSLTPDNPVAPIVGYARAAEDEVIVVAVNTSTRPASLGPVATDGPDAGVFAGAAGAEKLWGDAGVGPAVVTDGGLRFVLPPRAAAMWTVAFAPR